MWAIGIIFNLYQHSYTKTPPIRKTTDYESIMANRITTLLDKNLQSTFSVKVIERITTNWTIITIENKSNHDTLKSLLYEPTRSNLDTKVILAPTKFLSADENLDQGLVLSKEVIDALEKYNEDTHV